MPFSLAASGDPWERPVLGQGCGAEAWPNLHISLGRHGGWAAFGAPGLGSATAGPLGVLSPLPKSFLLQCLADMKPLGAIRLWTAG